MNSIYSKVGESFQQIGGECPDGFIIMKSERPGTEYVAKEDGTWIKITTIVDNVTVDTTVLDMAETMVALNERLTKLEGGK